MMKTIFLIVLISFFLFTGSTGLEAGEGGLKIGVIYSFQTSSCQGNQCLITADVPGKCPRILQTPPDMEAAKFRAVAPLDPNVKPLGPELGLGTVSLESVKHKGHYLVLGRPNARPYETGNSVLLLKPDGTAEFKTKATFILRKGFADVNDPKLISMALTNSPGRDIWVKNVQNWLFTHIPGQPRYFNLVTWRIISHKDP
jgi:hypothetical protein